MSIGRIAALVSSLVVLIAIIAGFIVAGSPSERRLERLDERRVSDLQQLSRALDVYWSEHQELPENLLDLLDGRRLAVLPVDPVSRLPYAYQPLSPDHYRLCAQFDRASPTSDQQQFWEHPAGQHCYEFQVAEYRSRQP